MFRASTSPNSFLHQRTPFFINEPIDLTLVFDAPMSVDEGLYRPMEIMSKRYICKAARISHEGHLGGQQRATKEQHGHELENEHATPAGRFRGIFYQ
jgi:hypothetical protein